MKYNRHLHKMCLSATLVLFALAVSAQVKSENAFQIKVKVANLKTPAKLILTVRDVNQWTEYTAEANDGRFVLTGTVVDPSFAYLVMKYGNETDRPPRLANITELFIEKGTTGIHTNDSLRNAMVKGGPMQKELESLNQSIKALKPDLVSERNDAIKNFVSTHPDSYMSLYALQSFSDKGDFTIDPNQVSPLFKLLTPRLRNTTSGIQLDKEIKLAERTSIGSIAPDFMQQDTSQQNVQLNSFRGQYVLIDFWASWCKPCRAENPELVKTYQEFKDRNFTVISVSLDNNKSSWLKAIRKDKLTWSHTSDLKFWKNEVALLFGVKTVPQNFLIDPTGKIVGKNIPAARLASELKQIIQ